jgi:hypothetical protein
MKFIGNSYFQKVKMLIRNTKALIFQRAVKSQKF